MARAEPVHPEVGVDNAPPCLRPSSVFGVNRPRDRPASARPAARRVRFRSRGGEVPVRIPGGDRAGRRSTLTAHNRFPTQFWLTCSHLATQVARPRSCRRRRAAGRPTAATRPGSPGRVFVARHEEQPQAAFPELPGGIGGAGRKRQPQECLQRATPGLSHSHDRATRSADRILRRRCATFGLGNDAAFPRDRMIGAGRGCAASHSQQWEGRPPPDRARRGSEPICLCPA